MMNKAKAGSTFTSDQLAWLNQLGDLGRATRLFGEQLPKLLDELNAGLAE